MWLRPISQGPHSIVLCGYVTVSFLATPNSALILLENLSDAMIFHFSVTGWVGKIFLSINCKLEIKSAK